MFKQKVKNIYLSQNRHPHPLSTRTNLRLTNRLQEHIRGREDGSEHSMTRSKFGARAVAGRDALHPRRHFLLAYISIVVRWIEMEPHRDWSRTRDRGDETRNRMFARAGVDGWLFIVDPIVKEIRWEVEHAKLNNPSLDSKWTGCEIIMFLKVRPMLVSFHVQFYCINVPYKFIFCFKSVQ